MTILGVDTSTRSCSAAIVAETGLLAEITLDNDQTHARHVMALVDRVLALAGVALNTLDGFAVTRGPGSFTGLRIGLSTIMGLGQATGKPIVTVSSLEVLAAQVPSVPMPIVSMIDAYRNEVYLAAYRYDKNQLNRFIEETVIDPEKISDLIQEPSLLVGNGTATYRRVLVNHLGERAMFTPNRLHTIRGATVAELGLMQLTSKGCEAKHITPVYLRKSDAELNRK